jgi:hypothetical protein
MDMPQPQPATSIAAPQARTACPPAPASSRSSGTGQVMPITAAQRMYFRSPCGRSRPNGRSYFRPRISNLPHRQSAGIGPPFATGKRRTLPGSDCRQRSPPHPTTGWPLRSDWVPLSDGIGGRIASFPHRPSQWPDARLSKSAPHDAAHVYRHQSPTVIQVATTIFLERSRISGELRYPLLPAVICRGRPISVVGGRP